LNIGSLLSKKSMGKRRGHLATTSDAALHLL
jgi:hypothetical protein